MLAGAQAGSPSSSPPAARPSSASDTSASRAQTEHAERTQATTPQTGLSNERQSIDPALVQKAYGKAVAVIDLGSLTPDQSRALQRQLASAGYYHGKVDGIIGPGTRQALSKMLERQYMLNQRLLREGKLTEPFVAGIGVQSNELAPVSGIDPHGSQMATPRELGAELPANPATQRASSAGASDAQSDEPGTAGTSSEPGPSDPRAD
jgi:hypothetical protein